MKQFVTVGLFFALSAGAPLPASSQGGPAPQAAPPAELTRAPEHWWLLDGEEDGVRGISAVRAYRELLDGRQPQREVVVAIIDSGVDIHHEDLRANLWTNPGEIPGNGIDDDGNGYVDDVHGWNFIGGPDGRHVDNDTYEVTRLYAAFRDRFEGVRADTLSPAAHRDYDEYQSLRQELETERAEAQQMLQQARMINVALERATSVLQGVLGAEPLSEESVTGIRSTRPDVAQARDIYLQLAEANITSREIERAIEYAERRLQYGLNPEFDPRPIVGDRYEDLTERFYGNADVIGPDAEHGTHVAGIVAAERGNRIGIDGIAPTARIMVLRAVPNGDERDKDVANAIRYAVDNGAHIINMSFGKAYSPHKAAVDDAVRYAEERGVLLVHAAGNEATELALRANFPSRVYLGGGSAANWIEVGASSWQPGDALVAPFSNFDREQVDVFAPGVDIVSTVPGNEYEPNSGTSMAAPVVSGLAALLMAYFPDLSAADVRRIILESAVLYGDETVVAPGGSGRVLFRNLSATGGVVNVYTAVEMALRLSAQNR